MLFMPINWESALSAYQYPFNLNHYVNAATYPGYFTENGVGDRTATIRFEDRFRQLAATHIEVWLEVVFWKMYSQANRRTSCVQRIAEHFRQHNVKPQQLVSACEQYIRDDSRDNLRNISSLMGFTSGSIAIAATFPAFLSPELFPMVDTRIAKWVGHAMDSHNKENPRSPQLVRPAFLDNNDTVLTQRDINFVKSWTRWCRYKAEKLNAKTAICWRPRDVEMAVFTAWGDRKRPHPSITLETF
jgi:hypothetical protein